MITIDKLAVSSKIRHGFFTREGGVSEGLYASLNCGFGSDDRTDNVSENRSRILAGLDMSRGQLLTCHQVHSAVALVVSEPWNAKNAPQADGMVTTIPGIALGILTADCAPVLFADKKAKVIGAAHAGWQGAFSGIIESTLAGMVTLGSSYSDIEVAIGPCIGANSYEVGTEFWDRFIADSPKNAAYFTPSLKIGHHQFDLTSYIIGKLEEAGIAQIYYTDHDTFRDEDLFYSYRRSVLRGEKNYGREISVISLVS
jgi:YfiH family protein